MEAFTPSSKRTAISADEFHAPDDPFIPLHEARMLAPGCTRTMHLYDSSCLAAFKAAMAEDGAFALVALDTFSAATRSFSLRSLACAVQILNVRDVQRKNVVPLPLTSIKSGQKLRQGTRRILL